MEKIFAAMRATYGAAFDRQWECPAGVDPVKHAQGMKAFWARELGPLQREPEALRYALDNLPDQPPNLVQFKAICNRSPAPAFKALPAPDFDRERATDALALAKSAVSAGVNHPKAWAVRIVESAAQGIKVPSYNLRLAREALGLAGAA